MVLVHTLLTFFVSGRAVASVAFGFVTDFAKEDVFKILTIMNTERRQMIRARHIWRVAIPAAIELNQRAFKALGGNYALNQASLPDFVAFSENWFMRHLRTSSLTTTDRMFEVAGPCIIAKARRGNMSQQSSWATFMVKIRVKDMWPT